MKNKIKAAWWRLPSWLRAAINTSWVTFVANIGLPVLRWLDDLRLWIEGTASLPSAELLGRVIAAAGVSLVAGIIAAVFRRVRPPERAYPKPMATGGYIPPGAISIAGESGPERVMPPAGSRASRSGPADPFTRPVDPST